MLFSRREREKETIKQDKPTSQAFRELGRSGLKRFGGAIYEEFLPQLSGGRAVHVYQEMSSNDPVVGAVLFAIKMLIRQATWSVEPYSDEQEDQEAAEFLRGCMSDMSMSWEDTINDVLSFLIYGWAYCEIVYKRRLGDHRDPSKRSRHNDGRIGWRKIPLRAQETLQQWRFDKEGGIQAMVQRAPPDYGEQVIPIEKALLFRTDTSRGNPEGVSILRNGYRTWYFKKNVEEIEAIGIERDLAGLPVVWVPQEVANPVSDDAKATKQAFLSLVTNIRRDKQEGVVMPNIYDEMGNKLYDLTLLSTGSRRQFDTTAIIERYSRQIAMTVLADLILLGHERVGSYRLGESKSNLFMTALNAWPDSMASVFNRHAVPRLWRLNGWSTDRLPRITCGEAEGIDLATLGQYIGALAGVGAIIPDEEMETYLRRLAGLPTVQEGEKTSEDDTGSTSRYP